MNVDPSLLPWGLLLGSQLLFVPALLAVLLRAPWQLLRANGLESVFISAMGCVAIAWTMRAGIHPGLELHLLGVTGLTMLFGWRLAVVGASLALAVLTVLGFYHWPALALNGFLLVLLPAVLTHWLGRQVYGFLPHHFLVYVFVLAFFGAMLSMAVVMLASAGLLYAVGAYPPAILGRDYLALLPLIMFPEGFITGMVMTMLVVYRPSWVRTFDDRDYIDKK